VPRRLLSLLVLLTAACSGTAPRSAAPFASGAASPSTTSATTAATTTSASTTTSVAVGSPIEIALRIDVHTVGADDFAVAALATLNDPRGWGRAGFHFREAADAPFRLVLAEAAGVDQLCLPYDTFAKYSCQNGPVVALNADRWRTATPKWTGDLATYRQYLVQHEVGHLLGMHHPKVQCPRRGRPAPTMNQQSTELDGCLPNPWPVPAEIALAAARPATLAPPYEPD
jgi:hypothetical protein